MAPFVYLGEGFIGAGHDLRNGSMTLAEAELACTGDPACAALTFESQSPDCDGGPACNIYLKTQSDFTSAPGWQSLRKGATGGANGLAAGVSGLVAALPPGFEQRVLLVGRAGGASAAWAGWGAAMTAGVTRLSLDADAYNRRVHYMTDNGAIYCYCNDVSGVPMRETVAELIAYHKVLGISPSVYHFDPFWHSHHLADGHCDGVTASAWNESQFHWAPPPLGGGIAALGVDTQMLFMLLAGPSKATDRPGGNVYEGDWPMIASDTDTLTPGSYDGVGGNSQVAASHSAAFWAAVLGERVRESRLRALVLDTLFVWYQAFAARLNNTLEQEQWLTGLFGAASALGLPVRVDQSNPSDHMASAEFAWPAFVSARCGWDQDSGETWPNMASTGNFLAALQVRPIMDVLWTTTTQPTRNGGSRPHIAHELVIATLTTGPVGIGDALDCTNVTLLRQATRADDVILKPCAAAARLDAFYADADFGPGEVWAAASAPARSASAAQDRRADSRAALAGAAGATADGLWWWTLLATNVDTPAHAVSPSALWPPSTPGTEFVAAEWGKPCANGSAASACLSAFGEGASALNASTQGAGASGVAPRLWRLFTVAPVLPGAWVLVGEEAKFVRVSPQRLVADATVAPAAGASDALNASAELEADGGGLSFLVIGAPGEAVRLTLVAPMTRGVAATAAAALVGQVLLVDVALSASGAARVRCVTGGGPRPPACAVTAEAGAGGAGAGAPTSSAAADAPRLIPVHNSSFAALNNSVLRAQPFPFDPRGPGADSTFLFTSTCCGYGPFSPEAVANASSSYGLFDVPCIYDNVLPIVAEWGYEFENNANNIFPLCGSLTEDAYSSPPANRSEAFDRLQLYWRCRAAAERNRTGQPATAPVVSEIGHYLYASMSALMDDAGRVIPGSEIGENINSIQMHLAHTRGAARQFGAPFLIDFSAWLQGSITDFSPPPGFWGAGTSSPVGGHSPSLFKRAYFAAFMAGSGMLVAEAGAVNFFFENRTAQGVFALSPLGEIGRSLYNYSHSFGPEAADARGIPYAPLAVVTEVSFGAGLGWFYKGLSWDTFALSDAELATQSLLDALWPGSFQVESQFNTPASESGYMVAGGLGDVVDLLLPRNLTAATLLGAYAAVLLTGVGDDGLDERLCAELVTYVAGGGSVVLSAPEAAAAVAAGWLPPSFLGFASLTAPALFANVSLVRDLQTNWTRAIAGAAPFCDEASESAGAFFIKTGGDPGKRSGWDGGISDKCCSTDAASCRWFATAAECAAALPLAPLVCRACAAGTSAGAGAEGDVGCPAWPPGGGLAVELFGVAGATTALPLLQVENGATGAAAACAVLSSPGGGSGSVLTLLAASTSAALAQQGLGLAPHLLGRLGDDTAPVAVQTNATAAPQAPGGVQLLVNRLPRGWLLTLINNAGVTKQPHTAQEVDATQGRHVTLTLREGFGAVASAWASAGGALPVAPLAVTGGASVQLDVPAGDLAIVFLEVV